jgi:hypothetical protein
MLLLAAHSRDVLAGMMARDQLASCALRRPLPTTAVGTGGADDLLKALQARRVSSGFD